APDAPRARRRGRGPRGRGVRRSWWAGTPGRSWGLARVTRAAGSAGRVRREDSTSGADRACSAPSGPPGRSRASGLPSVVVLVLVIGVVRPAGDGHALHTGQLDELGHEVPDGEAAVEPDVHD